MSVTGALVSSCARVISEVPTDQMMLVRAAPPSFGFQRLLIQSRNYPEFGAFVSQRGVPDFLAETGNQDRRYFILYYLKTLRAFAWRTSSGNSRELEFAGAYPVTDKEFRMLDNFRRDPSKRPQKL